ncbi:MAG: hypothetical protein RR314_04700 [Oscillospiraceae bacterium]
MTAYFASAALCGRELTIKSAQQPAGRSTRGYIEPIDGSDTLRYSRPTRPGRVNAEEYLLIVGPSGIAEGETEISVTAGGRVYRLLRAEPIYVGGRIGHWEGVLRLKEGKVGA